MSIFQDPRTGDWYQGPDSGSGNPFSAEEEDSLRSRGVVRDPNSGDFYQVPQSSLANWRKPEPLMAPQAPEEPTLEEGVGLADYAKSVMAGGAQIGQAAGWLLKQAGAEDIGGAIETLGKDAVDYWNEGLSDAAKDAISREFVRKNEAGDWEWGDANLHTIGLFGAQSLLGTMAGAGAGAGITKVLQTFANPVGRSALLQAAQAGTRAEAALAGGETSAAVVQAAERGREALKKLALVDKVIGTAGFATGEGLIGGASAGVNVYDRVMTMDPAKIAENPRYRQVYESTDESMPELERHQYAAETVAREASSLAGLQSGLTTALLGGPMGAYFGSVFGKSTLVKMAESRAARAATGAAGEAAQEFAQGAAEQMLSNRQVRDAGDTDVGLWDDVLNQALGGALAGAPAGGILGTFEAESPEPNLPSIEELQQRVKPPQETLALPAPRGEADYTVGPDGEAIPRGQTRPDRLALPAPGGNADYTVTSEGETIPRGEQRTTPPDPAKQWQRDARATVADIRAGQAQREQQEAETLGTKPVRVPGENTPAWNEQTRDRLKTAATEAMQVGASRNEILTVISRAAKGETTPLQARRELRQLQDRALSQRKALPAPRAANSFEVSPTGEARQLTEAEARQADERVAAAEQARVEMGTAPTKAPGLGGKRERVVQAGWKADTMKRMRAAADQAVEAGVPREVADGVLARMEKDEVKPLLAARQLKQLQAAQSATTQTTQAGAAEQAAEVSRETPAAADQEKPAIEENVKPLFSRGVAKQYPMADRSEWYSDADYETQGGAIEEMSPDEYLARVRPLKMDDVARDNINDLKAMMQSGRKMDPLKIYGNGKEDGRHRAYAAKELGIEKVPVVAYGSERQDATPEQLETEARALAAGIRERSSAERAAGIEQLTDKTAAKNKADSERVSRLMQRAEALRRPPPKQVKAKPAPEWVKDMPEPQRKTAERLSDYVGKYTIRKPSESLHTSAQSFFKDYEIMPGVRDIPLEDLGDLPGYDDKKEARRIRNLADEITENGEIEPVFVAIGPDGEPYLMEGQHRARAFKLIGEKSIPARVVVDFDPPTPKRETATTPKRERQNDPADTVRRAGPKPQASQTADRVRTELKDFVAGIGSLVDVQIHATAADMSDAIGYQVPSDTKGAWIPGTNAVHIVAENNAPGEAITTAVHETFGHLAIFRYEEGRRAVDSVSRQIQEGAAWTKPYVDAVAKTHGTLTNTEQAAEVIALMAERGEKNLTMTKLIAGIRRFLRKLGVKIDYSDADIRDLIARSARAIRQEAAKLRPKMAALTPASTDEQILEAIEEQFPSNVVALDAYMALRTARDQATGDTAELDAEIARMEGKRPDGDTTLHLKKPLRSADATIELERKRYPIRDANGKLVAETPEQQRNFWRWFKGSQAVDQKGRPVVLYHGTNKDFSEFTGRDLGGEVRHYFTTDPGVAGEYGGAGSGANVMPTYLALKNPLEFDADGQEWAAIDIRQVPQEVADLIPGGNIAETRAGIANVLLGDIAKAAEKLGHDGIIARNIVDGAGGYGMKTPTSVYIAFNAKQIKSATGNRGTFDPDSANILYRRGAAAADPKVQEILDRVMVKPPEAMTMRDRARELWHKITDTSALELKQGFIDSFASIEALERNANNGALRDAADSAYKAALATKNLSSVMAGVMLKGVPQFKNGAYQPVAGRKGIVEIFDALTRHKDGNLLSQWEGYAAARRASRLIKEKNIDGSSRENLFTQEEIDTLLTLGEKYPEFGQVFDEWQNFNKQVLDLAQEAGVVDPETRVLWERNDYVPFYRVAEELGDKSKGPSTGGGLANQKSGIRQLKGGEAQLGNVFENMMMNTAHLIDASFKNRAMQKIVELGTDTAMQKVDLDWEAVKFNDAQMASALRKAGIEVDSMNKAQREHWSTLFRRIAPKGPNIISVMVNGKPEYYEVTDPLVLQSIAGLGYDNFADVFGLFRGSKKLLTNAITADPAFMMANFVRDTLSNWVISDASTKPMIDAVKALKATMNDDPDLVQLMMAGAGGGGFYDSAPEDIRKLIASRVPPNQQRAFLDSVVGPKNIWRVWRKVGAAAENANRIATFRSVLAAGGSVAEAAYQARDVLNFGMAGNFGAMRWLTQSVPFLNARVQGLYRLYRGARDNKRAFFIKGMMLTAATMALALTNEDDERYEELPEWDKDTYWHLFLGDEHYRIPKPFEIGALFSTIPERMYRTAAGRDSTSILADRMFQMFSDTFAFNPVPQLVKPVIEQYANRSMFTGSPIVGMAEQPLQPEAQFTPWTSETMQELAKAMPDFAPAWLRSPKRLEAAMRAYTGAIGMYILSASDQVVRSAMGYPPEPGRKIYDLPVVSRFWKDPDPRHTKYADELYRMMDEANAVSSTVNRYTRERRFEEAAELRTANKDKLAVRVRLNRLGTQVRNVNNQIRLIQLDRNMDSVTKRERIDALVDRKNDITREVARYSDIF